MFASTTDLVAKQDELGGSDAEACISTCVTMTTTNEQVCTPEKRIRKQRARPPTPTPTPTSKNNNNNIVRNSIQRILQLERCVCVCVCSCVREYVRGECVNVRRRLGHHRPVPRDRDCSETRRVGEELHGVPARGESQSVAQRTTTTRVQTEVGQVAPQDVLCEALVVKLTLLQHAHLAKKNEAAQVEQ
jgi:hypothetical protein